MKYGLDRLGRPIQAILAIDTQCILITHWAQTHEVTTPCHRLSRLLYYVGRPRLELLQISQNVPILTKTHARLGSQARQEDRSDKLSRTPKSNERRTRRVREAYTQSQNTFTYNPMYLHHNILKIQKTMVSHSLGIYLSKPIWNLF
jgi:hypothetical protein